MLMAIVSVAVICVYRYAYVLTPLQHFYLTTYIRCGLRSEINLSRTGRYLMLNVVDGSQSQRRAVEEILSSRDQVVALEGVAGTGKTTSLVAVREAAEREGYKVEGCARRRPQH